MVLALVFSPATFSLSNDLLSPAASHAAPINQERLNIELEDEDDEDEGEDDCVLSLYRSLCSSIIRSSLNFSMTSLRARSPNSRSSPRACKARERALARA
jgi:hypothetical protein